MLILIGFPSEEIELIRGLDDKIVVLGPEHLQMKLNDIVESPPQEISGNIEEQRIVLLHKISREKIGEIIREIRKRIPMHIIFATSTPTSLEWKIKDLIEELKEEDLYFSRGGNR